MQPQETTQNESQPIIRYIVTGNILQNGPPVLHTVNVKKIRKDGQAHIIGHTQATRFRTLFPMKNLYETPVAAWTSYLESTIKTRESFQRHLEENEKHNEYAHEQLTKLTKEKATQ